MRKGGVRAEGVGYELSPVRVPEVQMRAVVRTHLVALLVLLVLRREANEVHRVAGCELHGRHHARGSLGGAERRELRLRRRGERAGGGYHHHGDEGEAHHDGKRRQRPLGYACRHGRSTGALARAQARAGLG